MLGAAPAVGELERSRGLGPDALAALARVRDADLGIGRRAAARALERDPELAPGDLDDRRAAGSRLPPVVRVPDHAAIVASSGTQIVHRGDDLGPALKYWDPDLGELFAEVEHATFHWTQPMPPADLRLLAASRSHLLLLPDDERGALLDEVDELVATHPDASVDDDDDFVAVDCRPSRESFAVALPRLDASSDRARHRVRSAAA
jgi:hypothetical protein